MNENYRGFVEYIDKLQNVCDIARVMLAPLLPMSVGHNRLGATVICGARHDIMEQA